MGTGCHAPGPGGTPRAGRPRLAAARLTAVAAHPGPVAARRARAPARAPVAEAAPLARTVAPRPASEAGARASRAAARHARSLSPALVTVIAAGKSAWWGPPGKAAALWVTWSRWVWPPRLPRRPAGGPPARDQPAGVRSVPPAGAAGAAGSQPGDSPYARVPHAVSPAAPALSERGRRQGWMRDRDSARPVARVPPAGRKPRLGPGEHPRRLSPSRRPRRHGPVRAAGSAGAPVRTAMARCHPGRSAPPRPSCRPVPRPVETPPAAEPLAASVPVRAVPVRDSPTRDSPVEDSPAPGAPPAAGRRSPVQGGTQQRRPRGRQAKERRTKEQRPAGNGAPRTAHAAAPCLSGAGRAPRSADPADRRTGRTEPPGAPYRVGPQPAKSPAPRRHRCRGLFHEAVHEAAAPAVRS